MKKIMFSVMGCLMFLVAGCDEAPLTGKYIFDKEDHAKNIDIYTYSKKPMASAGCKMMNMFFLKDLVIAHRNGKRGFELMALSDKSPGTTINVMEDKIVWDDYGAESPLKSGKIDSANLKSISDIKMLLVSKEDNIQIKFEETDKIPGCLFPFKKVAQ